MIALCLGCTALAVGWLLGPSTDRSTHRRLTMLGSIGAAGAADAAPDQSRRSGATVRLAAAGGSLLALVGVTDLVAGPAAAVVLLAAAIAVGTAARLVWLQRRAAAARGAREDTARACAVIAAQVRVGRVLTDALVVAAADCPVLEPAARVHRIGGDVAATLHAQARRAGHGGLAELARAWQLAVRTGAPVADVLDRVAEAQRRTLAMHRTVAAELSGPRATGRVMAVLPLCGLALGYLLGGDPVRFLISGPMGWACLVGGVVLASVGVLWVDWLARQAATFD